MDTFLQDLRYGVRVFLRNPGFTAVAVLVLALGIGANSAIFSVINAVFLRPLPFREPERLIFVHQTQTQLPISPSTVADYLDWKARTKQFENISCFVGYGAHNFSGNERAEQLRSVFVSADLFPMLGVQPMLGRNFLASEDKPDHHRVVLMSYGLWQRRFGADRSLIGKPLKLDGLDYTVVGIMPPDFRFPISGDSYSLRIDLWVPFPLSPKRVADRNTHYISVLGRLKPGVTLEKAQTEMTLMAKQMEKEFPKTNIDHGIKLIPLHENIVSNNRLTLWILFGTVVVVLLIACANAANLLLARAASRRKEIAIRTALGVGRIRMLRQLLTESTLLAIAAGALGLLLGSLGTRLLITLSPQTIPRLEETSLDLPVLGFTFAVSILTGLFFGLFPALQLIRTDLNESLNESGRSSASGGHARFRNSLVVAEVALAFLLFIASGLMMKSLIRVLVVEPGLNPVNLLTAELSLSGTKYPNPQSQAAFLKQIVERTKNLPGVDSVAGTTILPLSGGDSSTFFNIIGEPPLPDNQLPGASFRAVTPNYFRTMGIPFLKGRDFNEQDDGREPKAVLISQRMADKYWSGKNPIGQQINIRYGTGTVLREIVGIVGNVKHFGLDQDVAPEMYFPLWEDPEYFMYLVARTKSDPLALAKTIQQEVARLDRDQPVANIKTMENYFEESVAPRRFSVFLITVFAGIALVLSSIGIYSVISYSVSQRRNELGIRMALGAQARDILRLVVGQGFKLIVLGIAIGLGTALALTRLLTSLLFNVSSRDPFIFIAISLILAVVALLASYIPARRATQVDPMRALRYE